MESQFTFFSSERDWLLNEIRNSLRSAEWDLDDLAHTIRKLEGSPGEYGLSLTVIAERRHFLQQSKAYINKIRQHLGIADKHFIDPSVGVGFFFFFLETALTQKSFYFTGRSGGIRSGSGCQCFYQ